MEGNESLLTSSSQLGNIEKTAFSSSSSSGTMYEMFEYSLQVADVVNISITTTSYDYIDGNGSSTSSYVVNETNVATTTVIQEDNYWALLAIILVVVTAGGNILVCLAIAWERRLQNVTNYFLMSLAITDLMVAVLVMPFAILTMFKGYFPLDSEYCLVWICLDVLFCTASIMHLCTISVDRYLSLRYPMKFGRNKTRKRVVLKIAFVWLLSIAMGLPLSLMYSADANNLLVNGTCQIPDPVYKLVGSIVCFYIPFKVMFVTYCLTVKLLNKQSQNLCGNNNYNTILTSGTPTNQGSGWSSGWLSQSGIVERRGTWRRLLKANNSSTANNPHSATSTDTEMSTLDTHELWLPDTCLQEATPSTMTALHQFGTEMLKLSKGLQSVSSSPIYQTKYDGNRELNMTLMYMNSSNSSSDRNEKTENRLSMQNIGQRSNTPSPKRSLSPVLSKKMMRYKRRRRASTTGIEYEYVPHTPPPSSVRRKRFYSLPKSALQALSREENMKLQEEDGESGNDEGKKQSICCKKPLNNNSELLLPPKCTCPYFGDSNSTFTPAEVKIVTATDTAKPNADYLKLTVPQTPIPARRKLSFSKTPSIVTWDSPTSSLRFRRGSSFMTGARTTLIQQPRSPISIQKSPLKRSATLRYQNPYNHGILQYQNSMEGSVSSRTSSFRTRNAKNSQFLFQRNQTVRSHHSRNSSVRNSSRHGRIIRLEQKATKVLGVIFFTFVILWAPFFILNLLPSICPTCEEKVPFWLFDIVTWLGYASSMVNPIFYTIFNKVFRQAFKKVLLCQYSKITSVVNAATTSNWRQPR
ncbi:hypothetical protein ACFFRR_001053 [Megaselia abdita]